MDGYGEYSDLPDDILEDLLGEGSSQVVPRRRQHSDEDGEPGPSQRQRHEDEVSRDTTQAAQPRRKRRRRGDEGLFVETDDSEAAEESAPTTRGTSLSSIPPQPNITSNGAQSRQLRNGDAGQAGNEAIDLTDVEEQSNLADVLSKQRQDAVLAQTEHAPARSILTGYKCPICMEDLDDATSTVCGHLFCHKCIMDTLRFAEDRRPDRRLNNPRGTCPVCRKPITGNDTPGRSKNLIPLTLKLTTRRQA